MRLHIGLATALGILAATAGTLPATAQPVPPGISEADVIAAISAPISVPAGETITVSLPVPVTASYSGGGWTVSSAGTAVTVTAPAEPGSSISVPVTAAGRSASITLTATGDTAPAAPGEQERTPAAELDTTTAETINLEATISGNTITAQMGLVTAARLYTQFAGTDREGVHTRYLDAAGRIISDGVQREVDKATRTLILTYPDGVTPDNPFTIQVVRDDAEVLLTVNLIDQNHPADGETAPTLPADTESSRAVAPYLWGALVVLIILAVALRSRRR
ncbi:MAG: hypothetical protein SPI77_02000 [Corynebacterium sp.]|nr:hypothetical protein [Corynebacterium sp.]